MLRGLKQHTSNIAAIVTVTDNGGSSGRLTQQMGVLPPGDLRNCLVALADAEPTLARLFQFRFEDETEGLAGHSFGNLFIAAMTEIYKGNYEQAIAATSKVLAIRGKVYPSTVQPVCLLGEMEDGTIIEGETQIADHPQPIKHVYLRPENRPALAEALEAIRLADAIILGPGSVYTSVIPNLLVEGIAEAVAKSRAVKVYVCNVMTQPGETDAYTAADHVRVLADHAPLTDAGRRRLLTHVLVNTERPSDELLARYAKHGQQFVEPDLDAIRALGYQPVPANLISPVRRRPPRLHPPRRRHRPPPHVTPRRGIIPSGGKPMTLTLTPETPDTEEDILAALRASEDDFADGRWVSLEDLEARLQMRRKANA